MSKWLQAPVLLCIDASAMARSAAAVVLGFQKLDPNVRIVGVIANRVGGRGHFDIIRKAVETECAIPVLGYLTDSAELDMPERHLGLIPAVERGDLAPLFNQLAELVEATVDLDALLDVASHAPPIQRPVPSLFNQQSSNDTVKSPVIAVAKDAAFNFYYPENLGLLTAYGARLEFFSPLAGDLIPESAAGLYIGGGFPEEFAAKLSQQSDVLEDFRHRVLESGLPTFAECGGFMFLCRAIKTRDGCEHTMVGAIPAVVSMQSSLAALGYREVVANEETILLQRGERARGHEFHYSTVQFDQDAVTFAYRTEAFGHAVQEGYAHRNILAGYTHLHFASNPSMATRFVAACRMYRQRGKQDCGT